MMEDILKQELSLVTEEEFQAILTNSSSDNQKQEIIRKIISNTILEDQQSKERADIIFRYLLNREGNYSDNEIEFITYYTIYLNYYRIKYTEDNQIKKNYNNMQFPNISVVKDEYFPHDNTLGAYEDDGNIILINEDLSILPVKNGNKKKLFTYIQTLSHEMIHF